MQIALAMLAGLALAASAGLRAFVPLLALSLGARLGWVQLNPSFDFLGSDIALIALAAAAILEFAGDKIPLVDHLLDAAGVVVRPAAGALAGLSLIAHLPAPVSAALAVFYGVIAFGTHAGKAHLRVGSTATTAGTANPVLSVVEDFTSGLVSLLAVLVPIVAVIALLLGILLTWRLLHRQRPARRQA